MLVVPGALLLIFGLLYLSFRSVPQALLVLANVPFALVGGVAAPWAARVRGDLPGLGTVFATMVGFYAVVLIAAPGFQRAGTTFMAQRCRFP